jgi:hypothetical protein
MIHGFVAGNLIVGSVMAVATTLVLWGVGMKGAIPLGIASGLLNLLPFLGLIASLALPLAAALLQFNTPGPYIVITLTILFLHVVSANLLIPKFIEVRRDGEDAVLCFLQNSIGGHGLVSRNQLQTLTTASLGRTFQAGSHGFGLFLYPTDCLRAGRMHAPTELF